VDYLIKNGHLSKMIWTDTWDWRFTILWYNFVMQNNLIKIGWNFSFYFYFTSTAKFGFNYVKQG
jgi:hypothetical protein